MPSKKKKYNARFPPARIKKIMQSDEEVGKVAQAVPVIISRALELFVESLLKKAEVVTLSRNAKTLTPSHLKQCILAEQRFDFLKDIVESIPDVQGDEDCATPLAETPRSSSSNSPFVFPTVGRSNSFAGPSTPATVTSVQSPAVINEPPPVIVSSHVPVGGRSQIYSQHGQEAGHYQQPYESVIQSHSSSSMNLVGVNSNPYIPTHFSSESSIPSNYQHHQQQPMSLNLPVLSHYEYLPNNLHFSPSSAPTNNNGMNFSMMYQQHHNMSDQTMTTRNNGPSSGGVIVSHPENIGAYQHQRGQQE